MTAQSRNIALLTSKNSKQDEIDALKKMAECAGTIAGEDTYLAQLFSSKMVEWVERKIRDDMPADLFQVYEDQAEMTGQARIERSEFRRQVEAGDHQISKLQEELAAVKKMAASAHDHQAEQISKLKIELEEQRKFGWEMKEETHTKERKIDALEDEIIIKLKAKLYDLMVADES